MQYPKGKSSGHVSLSVFPHSRRQADPWHAAPNGMGEAMLTSNIAGLLSGASALLEAQEALADIDPSQARKSRMLADEVMSTARELIERAVTNASSAQDRICLLDYAVDLDGAESPLAAKVARAFTEPTEVSLLSGAA